MKCVLFERRTTCIYRHGIQEKRSGIYGDTCSIFTTNAQLWTLNRCVSAKQNILPQVLYPTQLYSTHIKRAHTTTTQSAAQNNIPRGENLHVLHLLRSYPATNRGLLSMRSMILSLSVNRGRVIDATKRVRVHAMGTYSPENWTAPLICGHVSIGYIQNSRTNRPPRRD